MSKKEEIIINADYDYPKVSKQTLPKDKLYKENSVVIKREISLNKELNLSGQLKQIESYLNVLKTRIEKVMKDFLFLKLFTFAASKEDPAKYKVDFEDLEKYIARFNTDFDIVKRYFESINTSSTKEKDFKTENIEEIFGQVSNLYSYVLGLKTDISVFQKNYFHEFKVASYSLIRNKTIEEINDLILRVELELSTFKNIELANDYYIYNSGNEITAMINEFLKLKKKDNKLTYHYFLTQDAVLAFKYTEWVELFVKFNYILTKIGKSVIYTKDFINKYRVLETRYTIILVYSEIYK